MSERNPHPFDNVLSLFDGMSCLQIAIRDLGFVPTNYYASEIDKHAIRQTQYNFQETIQLGDVTKWRQWDIDWSSINFVGAGSPCQGFSFAGKQLAFDDPRSKLFFVFVDILNHIRKLNPDVLFILENVNMKQQYLGIISQYLGVFPVRINSNLVSAQNRDRWYWTNIRTHKEGIFGQLHSYIPQPEDRGILLKDILEEKVDKKYYVSEATINRMLRKNYSSPQINPDKTGALNTKNNSPQMSLDSGTTFISVHGKAPTQRTSTGRCLDEKHNYQFIKLDSNGVPKKDQNKSSCFTAGANSGGNHSDMDLICVAMRGRNIDNPSDRRSGIDLQQRFEPNSTGKTNCLTTVQKDNLVMQLNPSKESNGKQPYQQNRVYDISGQHPALSATLGGRNNIYECSAIRRLTPLECSRLQTIPTWYEWVVSDTQVYKMLGNGWTVEVIKHILSFIN